MKLDLLLVTVVLLNIGSGTPLHCKTSRRTNTAHRLCFALNKDGSLRGRVVSCARNAACDNPEDYPCGPETITSSTSISTRRNDVTTTYSTGSSSTTIVPITSSHVIAPIRGSNTFKFNITSKISTNSTLTDSDGYTNLTTINESEDVISTNSTETTTELPFVQNYTNSISTRPTEVTSENNNTWKTTTEVFTSVTSNVWPLTSQVPLNITRTASTSISSCNSVEKYPAPRCHQYFVCSSTSKYLLETCPDGSAFDRRSKRCTMSQALNCPHATVITTKVPNPLNPIINGANIIISAITALLIVLGFILIDFIL